MLRLLINEVLRGWCLLSVGEFANRQSLLKACQQLTEARVSLKDTTLVWLPENLVVAVNSGARCPSPRGAEPSPPVPASRLLFIPPSLYSPILIAPSILYLFFSEGLFYLWPSFFNSYGVRGRHNTFKRCIICIPFKTSSAL